jgi:HK97 family phage prohead protease
MDRIEIKLASDDIDQKTGEFSGYGAVFGNVDSYGDVIERGAFKSTLREWEAGGKYPPMLLQHGGGWMGGADDLLPIGQWTAMEENAKGLKVSGKLFALATERGQYLYEGLKSGVLDGLSIGYRARKFVNGTKPGEPRRKLTEIDLMEVSVVTFPANGKARVGSVKAAEAVKTIREFEDFLRDVGGFSNAAAKAIASGGFKAADPRDEDEADLAAMLRRNIATLSNR